MSALKLNIGSGNKPIKDWVNVDKYVDPGPEYDWIKNDVRTLEDVQDNSVSEILASHIIEHVHPSEVPSTLKRWYNVLAPGGKIALEQPDILKCATNLLQVLTTNNSTLVINNGLHGFYGNSKDPNDGMFHYWGYWPGSLSYLLTEAGFQDIIEETPTQKPWGVGIRDFRLVAYKPKGE